MQNLIFKRQPKAYQGSKTFKSQLSKENYIIELEKCVKQFNTVINLMTDDLYGVVYYFHKNKTGTDADNISKPIWDCLQGILFDDDKRIKLRTAGLINTSIGDITIIDVTNFSDKIRDEFIECFGTEDHFVYVECGLLNNSMYKFNWEANGN